MKHGELTTDLARYLAIVLEPNWFEILYDHGDTSQDTTGQIGRIVSWFGPEYKSEARLAFLDIAIVSKETGNAVALIEIEETTVKPKVIIGDVLATLLGDRITFKGERTLDVGPWTTLIVFVKGMGDSHGERIWYLQEKMNLLKSSLGTPNATIDRIVIQTFQGEVELQSKATELIGKEIT
jgi:hypothetical protein